MHTCHYSGIEASDLRAESELGMIAQSLIRDVSVGSSPKEGGGGRDAGRGCWL